MKRAMLSLAAAVLFAAAAYAGAVTYVVPTAGVT